MEAEIEQWSHNQGIPGTARSGKKNPILDLKTVAWGHPDFGLGFQNQERITPILSHPVCGGLQQSRETHPLPFLLLGPRLSGDPLRSSWLSDTTDLL